MQDPADQNLQVILFGGAGIHVGSTLLRGRATHRPALALIAYLLANAGRAVTRDKLIALLWPERDTEAGRNLLKVNVHELRKVLGESSIRSIGDQLSADLGAVASDVADFVAAIARGNDATAVALYTGPFLDGFFMKDAPEFEQWVDGERTRLGSMYGDALDRLAAAAEARGDLDSLIRWRRAHAAHEPYHADVAHRLIQALALSGDRAGAIQFAQSFVDRRMRDLDIGDDHGLVATARRLTTSYTPPELTISAAPPATVASMPVAHVAESTPRSATRGRSRVLIASVVGIAMIASAAAYVRGHRSTLPAKPGIAVMPFRIFGADSTVGSEFRDLLAARFTGEDVPTSVERRDATQLLSGDITSAGDSIAIASRITDAATGSVVASATVAAPEGTSLVTLADRIVIELSARAAGEPEDRIGTLVRRPAIAARKYLAAQLAYKSARYAFAESLYAQSLAADSTFGAAGLGLAMANSWTVINDHYGQGRDAAMRNLRSMSDRDRDFALAFFGPDPALGPSQPAPVYLKRWEDIVEKYPDWTEAWYQLGDRYYHFGGLSGLADPIDRARAAFRRALSQDSTFAAPLHHLVEIYAERRELDALRDAGARYFRANPSVNRDRTAIGWEIATALGDRTWITRLRANLDSMPREELTRIVWVTDVDNWPRDDAERAAAIVDRQSGTASEHERAAILRFALSLNHGDVAGARAATASLGAQFPDRPVGALWDLLGATFATGDSALAADAARRLASFASSPNAGDHVRRDQHNLATCMTGMYHASRDENAQARAALSRLTSDTRAEDNMFAKRNAAVCAAMLSATIEVNGRSREGATSVARLDSLLLRERVPPHVILEAGTIVSARLHLALGDTAGAIVAARRREHLTGDPIFLSVERQLEASLGEGKRP